MKFSRTLLLCFPLITATAFAGDIVINEIMYNSPGNDVEFIELYNNSGSAVNLTNWYLLDDNNEHTHCTLQGTINAGGYFIIAGSIAQFQALYPNVDNINANEYDSGSDAWSFGNGGDAVRLFDNTGQLHDIVEYNDGGGWPTSPDGNGPSLELLYPELDNSLPTSWDPSDEDGGTPGAQNSVYTDNAPPFCKDGERLLPLPTSSDEVTITVLAFDTEGLEKVELMVSTNGGNYTAIRMNNNGTGNDEAAGDSIYTAAIPAKNNGVLVKYYCVATDNIGQTDTWPNGAPEDYRAYTVDYTPPDLRITEVLAVNSTVNTDEAGEYDDWFEIHNADDYTVNLGGMYVSSALNSSRAFELPSRDLAPDEYIIIWADNDEEQGSLHVDFKLSADGESVALFETNDHGNGLIHGWKYGRMSDDISMGFKPADGTAPEYLASPTPGASNESSELFSPVCINEFLSTSAFGGPEDDWVEIYNRGSEAYDLSGCFLSDERGDNTKWEFPHGVESVLQPDEYLVIYEDELKFGFASEGNDVIMLTAPDSTTGLDFYDFGEQIADHSEGRLPDGAGIWQKFDEPTRGESNLSTGIEDQRAFSPNEFTVFPNYPNPFNPKTTLAFSLPETQRVTVSIFDSVGRHITTLTDKKYVAGHHEMIWNAEGTPSGLYFYKITAGQIQRSGKMLLIK